MNSRKFFAATLLTAIAVLCVTPLLLAADPAPNSPATGPGTNAGSPELFSSASWGAIFAGSLVTLSFQLLFYTLGVGIGLAAVNPYDRNNPVKGIPTAAVIYMVATGLVALFAGGYVAGKLSGATTQTNTIMAIGGIHGLVVWGLTTMVIVWSLTNAAGNAIGGAAKLFVDGLGAVAQGTGAAIGGIAQGAGNAVGGAAQGAATVLGGTAQGLASAVGSSLNIPGLDWNQIKRETRNLLRDSRSKDPNADKGHGDPLEGDQELTELLTSMYGQVRDAVNTGDRDELTRVISDRTGKSKEEVKAYVDKAEKMYQDAKRQYETALATAEQKARDAAAATASTLSQCAIWTFASMIAGIVAATFGGLTGTSNPHLFPWW